MLIDKGYPEKPSKTINMVLNDAGTIGLSLNGKSFPATEPYTMRVGQTILVNYFNEGLLVHPMHLHMEEHRTLTRNGVVTMNGGNAAHPDDMSKEDLVALDPGESVLIYRGFRDFVGQYVAHCHNLAHEDHAMMFGWEITA